MNVNIVNQVQEIKESLAKYCALSLYLKSRSAVRSKPSEINLIKIKTKKYPLRGVLKSMVVIGGLEPPTPAL